MLNFDEKCSESEFRDNFQKIDEKFKKNHGHQHLTMLGIFGVHLSIRRAEKKREKKKSVKLSAKICIIIDYNS